MHHQCRGQKANGSACGALPHLLDEDGYCPAHRDGGREAMAERGRRGGLATKRRLSAGGLETDELPSLETHDDAKRWLEVIGRAVATGRLSDRHAQAAVRAVAEWVRTEGEKTTAEVVAQLKADIEQLQSAMKVRPFRSVG
jgi:hypothetical protein